jgi:hypothetical protein
MKLEAMDVNLDAGFMAVYSQGITYRNGFSRHTAERKTQLMHAFIII